MEASSAADLKHTDTLSNNLIDVDLEKEKSSNTQKSSGRWTKEEHQRFVEALKTFGKDWKKVEDFVETRNGAQIRSHAQKFFNRLQREYNQQCEGNKADSISSIKSKKMQAQDLAELNDITIKAPRQEYYNLPSDFSDHFAKLNSEEYSKENNKKLANLDTNIFSKMLKTQNLSQHPLEITNEKRNSVTKIFQRDENEANYESNLLSFTSKSDISSETPKNQLHSKIIRNQDQIAETHSILQSLKQNPARINRPCENLGQALPSLFPARDTLLQGSSERVEEKLEFKPTFTKNSAFKVSSKKLNSDLLTSKLELLRQSFCEDNLSCYKKVKML